MAAKRKAKAKSKAKAKTRAKAKRKTAAKSVHESTTKPPGDLAPVETFPNPEPKREYVIAIEFPEFTSVCPKTGLPDFATLHIHYAPRKACLEMKSLKLYFYAYRNRGVFYEAAVNRILDDLVASCRPRWMEVTGDFAVRGGMTAQVTARYPG